MLKKEKKYNVGDKYGSLTINRFELRGKNHVIISVCDCGKEKVFWKKSAITRQKSCGCGINDFGVNAKQRRSWNLRLQGYKNGAKKRGFIWDLSLQQFIEKSSSPCNYCGVSPKIWGCKTNAKSIQKDSPNTNPNDYLISFTGLDRINSKIGYTYENVVSCCVYCNRAKSDLSEIEFINHIKKIYEWQLLRKKI
jgi:hypothetical protein